LLGDEIAAHIMGIPLYFKEVVVEIVGTKSAVMPVAVKDPIEEASFTLPERYAQVDPQLKQVC
jgi:hypothetical protein